jgi:alginate O-acetyltransferase complex protein AlgI
MLFQSQSFLLLFLPATVAIWYATAASKVWRECALIALSLIFYAQWDVRFVPLLLGQIAVSWLASVLFLRGERRAKWLIVAAIAANLSVLVFFKYSTFLAGNIMALAGFKSPALNILLPIGISFYTFEIISYLADLAWRQAPPYSLRRFSLFVLLFPRLIAGPIVRHHEIVPQFDLDPRREGLHERLVMGATLLTLGLIKKVFLADRLAPLAESAFGGAAHAAPTFGEAWTGALAFTFQLFLDFSAYSEMAIGIALMLGFALPQNFNAPYASLNLRDFWRRWHMTLSRYLRDYVYIPLGGSRAGAKRYVAATLLTMGLCGLWHGAGWAFIVWGLMHGAGLMINKAWSERGFALPAPLAWSLTFLFVVAGWVVFRSADFGTARAMLSSMAGAHGFGGSFAQPLLIGAAAIVSMLGPTTYTSVTRYLRPSPALAALTATAALYVLLEVGAGQPQSFIYFQF